LAQKHRIGEQLSIVGSHFIVKKEIHTGQVLHLHIFVVLAIGW